MDASGELIRDPRLIAGLARRMREEAFLAQMRKFNCINDLHDSFEVLYAD
jgi:hypothetical protein